MPKPAKIYPHVDIKWLKKFGAIDAQSEKLIKTYLQQNKNIVILGNQNGGTSTFMHCLADHAFRLHHDPLLIPPMGKVNVDKYFKSQQWKQCRKLMNKIRQTIVGINYKGNFTDLYPYLKGIGPKVDVVIDMRNMQGKRAVCQIYERRAGKWQLPYLNDKYYNSVKAKFAAA